MVFFCEWKAACNTENSAKELINLILCNDFHINMYRIRYNQELCSNFLLMKQHFSFSITMHLFRIMLYNFGIN